MLSGALQPDEPVIDITPIDVGSNNRASRTDDAWLSPLPCPGARARDIKIVDRAAWTVHTPVPDAVGIEVHTGDGSGCVNSSKPCTLTRRGAGAGSIECRDGPFTRTQKCMDNT